MYTVHGTGSAVDWLCLGFFCQDQGGDYRLQINSIVHATSPLGEVGCLIDPWPVPVQTQLQVRQ
jgi:hypothetical protein